MQQADYSQTSMNDEQTLSLDARLDHLLPGTLRLQFDAETRVLSLISTETAQMLALQKFTRNEWVILTVLIECYPHYAPYEMLLAGLTTLSIDDCQQRLHEAQQSGTKALKSELKPVHRALSGIRTKLGRLCSGLKISFVRDAGYALTISPLI